MRLKLLFLVSGVVYLGATAAWLNLFTLVGNLPLVTPVAGLVAVEIVLVNIKGYLWFRQVLLCYE